VTLAIAGNGLARVVSPVWTAMREASPAGQSPPIHAASGQGISFALLGGLRALVANGVWLRMVTSWERRDLPDADALIHLTTAINPRPVYFWLNGARIIAHDFTAWRIIEAGGYDVLSDAEQERIGREQAARALRFLEGGMRFHTTSAELWLERASIELHRGRDVTAAAESYRRAAQQPRAPHYAARLHAELLRRLGRKNEALTWLVQLHPHLDPHDEAAAAPLVLSRIRELERELGVTPERAYRLSGMSASR
jgi:hypothetical protein